MKITILLALLALGSASAQEATELFIPIGKSPDLSNAVTAMGTIESVDSERRTIVVKTEEGTATAAITEKTKIFLDKSKLKQSNEYGDFEDLAVGLRAEILYQGRTRAIAGTAEWVKVEITQ